PAPGLIVTGTGKLTLSGQNTYSGSTVVSGGKLQLGSVAPRQVTINSGGLAISNTDGGVGSYGYYKPSESDVGRKQVGETTALGNVPFKEQAQQTETVGGVIHGAEHDVKLNINGGILSDLTDSE